MKKDLKELKLKAKSGDLDAKYRYYLELCNGGAIAKRKSKKVWQELIDADYPKALVTDADLLSSMHTTFCCEKKALELYKRAANKGDAYATYCVGYQLLFGEFEHNPEKGIEYIEKAKKLGYTDIWFVMGQIYEKGIGKKVDYNKAYEYYEKGTKAGCKGCETVFKLINGEKPELDILSNSSLPILTKDHKKIIEYFQINKAKSKAKNKNTAYPTNNKNYLLAMSYIDSNNLDKAFDYLMDGYYNDNDPYCAIEVALQYIYDKYINCYIELKNQTQGFEILKNIADKYKISKAQIETAICYFDGIGVKEDLEMAKKYLYKAVDQNDPEAYYTLISLSKVDIRDTKQYDLFMKYSKIGILSNTSYGSATAAIFAIKIGGNRLLKRAIEIVNEISDKNFTIKYYLLGLIYSQKNTSYYNIDKAIENFTIAANWRNIDSQRCLGEIYCDEKNKCYNLEKSYYWFKQAANAGNKIAQYNTAQMLIFGKGVEKNIELGKYYLELAAKAGLEEAIKALKSLD